MIINTDNTDRRSFLRKAALASAGIGLLPLWHSCTTKSLANGKPLFKISLGQWSLHRAIRSGALDTLDFPEVAKKEYGIDAVEYVNQLFMDKAKDSSYIANLKKRSEDAGVKNLVIMVDHEGILGAPTASERKEAVEKHYKWIEAAKEIGCHSVRVNAFSSGTYEDQLNQTAEGLRMLTEFSAQHDINIIVENHGGLSSRGDWLAELMRKVDHPKCGTMPDFDNFEYEQGKRYDRYKGMKEIMPWAKSVSTKAHDFDEDGNETTIDFTRMMNIVLDAGYNGYISAEYEGNRLSEPEGIRATIKLMERVREDLETQRG